MPTVLPKFHMALPESLRDGIERALGAGAADSVASYVRGAIRMRFAAEGIKEKRVVKTSKRGAQAAPPFGTK